MVQLQTDLKKIEAAGVQVAALSYDKPEVLARFAERRKITFPLLSDPDSTVIKAFGLLNKEARGKAAGVPYPGMFLLDKDGVIRAKLFLDGYRERHSTEELIKGVQGIN